MINGSNLEIMEAHWGTMGHYYTVNVHAVLHLLHSFLKQNQLVLDDTS